MNAPCACESPHQGKRIALTGGPGAGKTAVLELLRKYFCKHVRVLTEAASILHGTMKPSTEVRMRDRLD